MRAAGLVCLGAGAGLIRGDLRDARGTDVALPVRRRGRAASAAPRARTVPVLARYQARLLAAAAFAGSRPDLRRHRSGPPEHHEPAGHRAGRRGRPAPAGHLPAARDLAGRLRGAAGAGHVHARGRDQLLPAARRPGRRPGAGRRGRGGAAAGGRPAMIPLAALEEVIDASGVAPRIEAMLPAGVRARQLSVRTLLAGHVPDAGRRPARAPDPGAPGADQPARRRAAAARRARGLEGRPAPADLPAGRVHLRPGRQGARQGRAGRAAVAGAAGAPATSLLEASVPDRVQGRQHLAGRGLERPGVLLPAPAARNQRLRRPRGLLGTPQEQPAARRGRAVLRLLPVGRDHGARRARARRPRARPPHDRLVLPPRPRPRLHPRADGHARRRHPARRRPGRLRLLPPRPAALGIPAPRGRRRPRPGPAPPRPRPQGHPRGRRHRQREPLLPGTPAPLLELGPLARAATPEQAARTTRRPPRPPATSSAASPPTTPTATTASQCPAATGKIRCPLRPRR